MKNKVIHIEEDSIAQELGIEPGDYLVSINGRPVQDVFDYRYLLQDEFVEVLMETPDGEQVLLEIDKEPYEDLGLVFDSGLMDKSKGCANKCIFCFIDQLPKNMRKTLYFKDDDPRLSFLQGNYVTLTNLTPEALERVLYYHLSPINISVHTTDPTLRVDMLGNPKAAQLPELLDKLQQAGIQMNYQVVLCKGVNDGAQLDKTIEDLSRYYPQGGSLSVVPVGLTRFREGLTDLPPFTKEDSQAVLRQLKAWQKKLKKELGTSFVYAADEFYLKAEEKLPTYAHYEDFPQIENGVGMLALFERELQKALKKPPALKESVQVSVVTGLAAKCFMDEQAAKITEKLPEAHIQVFAVENHFFGEHITVAGLLTGQDILAQLKCKPLGDVVLIPQNALKAEETVFLDDMTVEQLEEALGITVRIVPVTGEDFLAHICQ